MIRKPLHAFRFEHRWHASSDSKRDRPYGVEWASNPTCIFPRLESLRRAQAQGPNLMIIPR